MSIQVPLSFDSVKGFTTRQGNTFFTDDLLRIPLPPIPAGVKANLVFAAYVKPRTGTTHAFATFDMGNNGVSASQWFNATYPIPEGANELTVTSLQSLSLLTLRLEIEANADQEISPYDTLAVEVYAPIADGSALQWDTSRWNRVVWNVEAPAPSSMRWNTSYWNARRWYDSGANFNTWQSIINQATAVTISRGMTRLGTSAIVGLMTVELKGAGCDPRALGLSIGTPARCYLKHSLTPLYTGNLVEAQINPHPTDPAKTTVTLTFADAVATLANTVRYGAKADHGNGEESFTARAKRLSKSARGIEFSISSSDVQIAPTVWETSLASHFDALTATTGGYWTVNRSNTVLVRPSQPSVSDVTISDVHLTRPALYYTEISEAWNSTSLVTAVESTTHTAVRTLDGWEAADRVITVEAPTQVATWVGATESVDLLTPLVGSAQRDAATRLLKRATQTPAIQSNTFHLTTAKVSTYTAIANLDPAQIINVHRNGEIHTMQIKEITHTITPTTWETTLNY
ncbi:hypothetical protein HMPREF0044_0132 [Gleimia coleocanis DSM 15436]|uniref:Minor tail protein n=1 Tax=Gleimia coleocanis DSM 15436 TaxID=525245 RepID=C0VY92_9ACTO|nr:hypothetical protein [Gleimia coleocanis]EEH64395.1 hypothetical protein HMPREF0044_0132 [Gleimia coleocanis DSM 15436]